MFADANTMPRSNHGNDSDTQATDNEISNRNSVSAVTPILFDQPRMSGEASPMTMSPWNQTGTDTPSPFTTTPWTRYEENLPQNGLIGSLVREEGHIYSLATSGDLLYTGSDSKNIRVWKNLKEFSGFKSSSGLVKAIVISGEKVFTGHQDGRIRIWKISSKSPNSHKRSGTLPTLKDIFKCSIKPSNYVEGRRNRSALWIKHSDAISCLSLNADLGLLYSASWDRSFKVWRISDSKCIESVNAHDDAVNSVVSSTEDIVFSGSADGTVKVWRRELSGKATKHTMIQTLLKQECAVTALAVNTNGSVLYCGSSDGVINFWEREKQLSHGGVLRGHKLAILCLAAAGNMVFSGAADKIICVWRKDGKSHTCLSVLTGHTGPVKCLSVEEDHKSSTAGDNRYIVSSGSLDKSVKVWSVSDQAVDLNHMAAMQQQMTLDGESSWGSVPSDYSFTSQGKASQSRMY